jgi:serine/threonine protein kinase
MSDVWKRWEGQVADHKYQLQHYLGSTDHSVVFLAEFREPEPCQAAIKFISADLANAEQQLAAWNNAAQLSHPSLIRLFCSGRCKIEDMELLYVAMECAEENLGQILPQRALTAEETREMLGGVADVLVYLHGKNLTHGHVKPSNILAIGERLKLSSDTILPAAEVREMSRERTAYDAPEIPASPYTPAADVWSLGATVVEALTQLPAILPFNEQAEPLIPVAVQGPFLEIARNALRRDPKLRWSIAQVAEQLNPAPASAKASVAVASALASAAPSPAAIAVSAPVSPSLSPVTVPLSKEPAVPLAKLPSAPVGQPAVARPPVRSAPPEPTQAVTLPSYVVPVFAAAFVLVAAIALPKILRHREESAASTVASAMSPESANAAADLSGSSATPADAPAKQPPAKASKNVAPDVAAKSNAPGHSAQVEARPVAASPAPAPAVLRSSEAAPSSTPKTSSAPLGRGEALDQVLPRASGKALATIQGTVHVGVKVHVDAAGNVSEAALEAHGPSRYFADLSLKAARGWVFSPPEIDGRSVPSEWMIQFYFTQSGARAVPQQLAP